MVFYSKKPLEVPNNEKFTNPTAITYSEYLTPEEGLKKYGEKGKNGVIIETLIK